MTAILWRAVAAALLAMLLVTGVGMGGGWWLAAHDRYTALTALEAEQGISALLRASIEVQNSAIDAMQAATVQADARGQAARQMAAAAGRRYDIALAKLGTVRAVTCADAMPAVNQLLESVR
ncbi:hypothetical protein [Duganella fentianensis]|uniref:hypothetical protein n=1 Tax=Duganella fentianensis TaxID=2692177 RepID=UPI0032B28873